MADGRIIIETKIDTTTAEQDVKRLKRTVEKELSGLNKTKPKVEIKDNAKEVGKRVYRVKGDISDLSKLKPITRIRAETEPASKKVFRLKGDINNLTKLRPKAKIGADTAQAESKVSHLKSIISKVATTLKVKADTDKARSQVDTLKREITGIAAKIGITIGIKEVIMGAVRLSDEFSMTSARLSLVNDGLQSNEALQQKVFEAAQRSRAEYGTMAELVGRIGLNAKDAFDNNQEAIDFAENLNKMFIIAGSSQEEIASATLQLTQALGSGVLRGEELNAVFEAAPNVIQTIADYLGVPIGQIRNMAAEGELTADVVKNALLGATDEINQQFEEMPMTFGQVWSSFKNESTFAIQEILENLNAFANSDTFKSFMTGLVDGIKWFVEHADTIGKVVTTIAGVFVGLKIGALISGIVGGIGALITAFAGAGTAAAAVGATMTALAGGPITLIIAVIGAVVAAVIYLWNTNEGFRDAVKGVWQAIKDSVKAAVDGIVTFFTETIPNAWEATLAFFRGAPDFFSGVWKSIKAVFQQGWDAIVSFFTETIPQWLEDLGAWFDRLPELIGYALGFALGTLIAWGAEVWLFWTETVPEWIESVGQWFSELPGRIGEWLTQTINDLIAWGTETHNTMSKAASDAIDATIKWFKELPGRVKTRLTETINKIVTWGRDMVTKAKEAASDVVEKVETTLEELSGKVGEVGKNIVKGLWEGIKSNIQWIKDKVGEFANGVLQGMKDALGIKSPSRVFRDSVGVFIAKGVGAGFLKELPSLKKTIARSVSGLSNLTGVTVAAPVVAQAVVPVGETAKEGKALAAEWTTIDKNVNASVSTMHTKTQQSFDSSYKSVNNLTDIFSKQNDGKWGQIQSLMRSAQDRIKAASDERFTALKDAALSIMDTLSQGLNKTGGEAVMQLAAGIDSRQSDATSSASALVTLVIDKFKEGFGIQSPSRIMFEIGRYLIEGFIKGLKDDDLLKFVDSMIADMKAAFEQGNFDILKATEIMGDDASKLFEKMGIKLADMAGALFGKGGIMFPTDSKMITSGFGPRESPGGVGSTYHQGIDIGAAMGDPVYAAYPGTVTTAGWLGGYGNTVIIDHGNGLETLYAHLSEIGVSSGMGVAQGQVVGLVGSTGNSTGPHLHFSVIMNGQHVDPMSMFPGFAVGSRYIPRDMLAVIHEGEAVVRKKDNPYANSGGSFWEGLLTSSVLGEIAKAKNYPGVANGANQAISHIVNNTTNEMEQYVYFQETPKRPSEFRQALKQEGRRLAFGQ